MAFDAEVTITPSDGKHFLVGLITSLTSFLCDNKPSDLIGLFAIVLSRRTLSTLKLASLCVLYADWFLAEIVGLLFARTLRNDRSKEVPDDESDESDSVEFNVSESLSTK